MAPRKACSPCRGHRNGAKPTANQPHPKRNAFARSKCSIDSASRSMHSSMTRIILAGQRHTTNEPKSTPNRNRAYVRPGPVRCTQNHFYYAARARTRRLECGLDFGEPARNGHRSSSSPINRRRTKHRGGWILWRFIFDSVRLMRKRLCVGCFGLHTASALFTHM